MADFDFDDVPASAGGNDVSDFLKREQETLGAFGGAAPQQPASAHDDFFFGGDAVPAGSAPQSATQETFGNEAFGSNDNPFGTAAPADDAAANGEESVFYTSQQTAYVDPYAALSQVTETPAAIREWRAKRESYLETKDKASKDKVKQLESDAKAALDAFNKEYQAKKDATKKKNKEAQAATIAALSTPSKTNAWEGVYNLVDLTPKGQKSTKDVSRVRTILTQLKTDAKAPGAK